MQSKNYPSKTNFLNIQDEYLNRVKAYTEKQYKRVAMQIILDVIQLAEKNNSDQYSLKTNLDLALDLLLDLKHAVNNSQPVWNKSDKIETLYNDFNWNNGINPWMYDQEKIDIILLNEIINKYLSYEWFSSPIFEHIIINAYLRYCIDINRKELIFLSPMSAQSMAACCTTKKSYYKTYAIFKIIGMALNWVLPIWLLIHALTNGWLIISALSGIFISYSIISMLAQKRMRTYNLKTLLALIDLKTYITGKTWSPTVTIDKIKKLNKKFNIPELLPLFSKISKRNSEIFNVRYH